MTKRSLSFTTALLLGLATQAGAQYHEHLTVEKILRDGQEQREQAQRWLEYNERQYEDMQQQQRDWQEQQERQFDRLQRQQRDGDE